MGRKRSYSSSSSTDEDEDIKKKIAKLQKKLCKKRRRRVFIASSSSKDENNRVETMADVHESFLENDPVPSADCADAAYHSPGVADDATTEATAAGVSTLKAAANVNSTVTEVLDSAVSPPDPADIIMEKELDNDILELLGDAPKAEVALGPAVHKDIATRWQEILKNGLQKETKEKLMKDYAIPSNCNLLLAPELNAEVKVALPDISMNRDAALCAKQRQIGSALAALAVSVDRLVKDDSKESIIKPLSDACRILCDNHYAETRVRRKFVVSTVNPSLRDALTNTPRDKYLFGDNITDKVKAAQTIQKSGEALKAPAPQKTPYNNKNAKRTNLNYQHRKSYTRGASQAARGGRHPGRGGARPPQQDRAPPTAPRRERSPPPKRAAPPPPSRR